MNRFRLAVALCAAFFVALIAAPVGSTAPIIPPTFSVSVGAPVSAGSPETFTITRTSGTNGWHVLFETRDGSAKNGTDYTAIQQLLYFKPNATSLTVTVPTSANQSALGQTLSFYGIIASSTASSAETAMGSIIEPAPPPAPAPAYPVLSPNGLTGETTIPSNFNESLGIEPTWYGPLPTNRGGTPPVSADQVGAFRIVCLAGPVLPDDPIVLPGQPGKSHLHQFFGNTGVNGNSTYQSLRTSGGTTCGQASTPLNRSAYWTPAMLDGAGNVVKPDYLQVYYKQIPKSAPECQGAPDANHIGFCVDLPNGIRYVTGYNTANGQGGPTSTGFDPFNMYFQCWGSLDGKVVVSPGSALGAGHFTTIAAVVAAGCPVGAQLVVIGINPSCWDGKSLDVADHRSHMANEIGVAVASIGLRSCPPDHPYVIPSLQIQYHYTVDANFVAGKWRLSSDDMVAQMTGQPVVAGTTLHFDYWEAWSPTVKATWEKYCVNGHLTCAGGDLGNGTDIIRGDFPPGGPPIHQLIPVP